VAAAKAEKEAAAKAKKEEAKRLKDEAIAKKKKLAKGAKTDEGDALLKSRQSGRCRWPHAGAAAAAERQRSHFLLATWHGPHKDKLDMCQLCLKELCKHLRDTCDESADCLGCVLAGDFNLDLHPLELADYVGFERLDPD